MLSPSQPSWLNYDVNRLLIFLNNLKAKERGTKLHEYAQQSIELERWCPEEHADTVSLYVNDAISFNMRPEQILFYSKYFFGTADAISFDGDTLRIHDLKTGSIPGKMDQLLIYDALFCLEYGYDPHDFDHVLRIYQFDDYTESNPTAEDVQRTMDIIQNFDALLMSREEE